jgi:YTH domain-containing family protein
MEMGMTPELMYGQNVFVPAAANPYPYGYTGNEISYLGVCSVVGVCLFCIFHLVVTNFSNAEVGQPMEWYNHPNSLGYDGQDPFYTVSTI